MPFDPNFKYGASTEGVTHASVPASTGCGRRQLPADFAIIYVGDESVGLAQRINSVDGRISRLELFKSHLDKAGATFNHCLEPNFQCEVVKHQAALTVTNKLMLLKYKNATLVKCAATYDAGAKYVMEDVTFTFDSAEESQVDISDVLK